MSRVTPSGTSQQWTKKVEKSDATGDKLRQPISRMSLLFLSNVLARLHFAPQAELNASLDRVVEIEGLLGKASELIAR
jgi:hypothetical protein